jgi:hypothetical protein
MPHIPRRNPGFVACREASGAPATIVARASIPDTGATDVGREAWRRPPPRFARGFGALQQDYISQANEGCDFEFLEGSAETPDPEIH